MVSVIRETLVDAVREALARAGLPEPADGVALEPPGKPEHGDWSTPVALRIQKAVGRPPATSPPTSHTSSRPQPPPHLERVEVMGPGLVNLFLAPTWLHDVLREAVARGERYGHGTALAGRRINLEFVSANPTGPMHAGGGRWVAVGDAIANLLASQGAEVHREYYLNDAGNQLDIFGASLYAALPRRGAARRRLPGRVPRRDGRPDARRAGRRRHRGAGPRVGLPRRRRSRSSATSRASACTSTRGSRSGPLHERGEVADVLADARRTRRDLRGRRRDLAARRPTSATSATACS